MSGGLANKPVPRQALPRVEDRWSFLYAERCIVHRAENALTLRDEQGTVHVPAATISSLLLGPGSTVSHQAMSLLGESGVSVVWVGENGVRFYASGRSLADSNALLQLQARCSSSQNERIKVARAMYQMRFGDEDVEGLSMRQLRGREGHRMKMHYRRCADEYGVPWAGRIFDSQDFQASDPVNQALSAGNATLYGIAHAVICALGCSPGLGIVHTGHSRSFVFDIADLYKGEFVIPLAFQIVSEGEQDVATRMRIKLRDRVFQNGLLKRCAQDIIFLLTGERDAPVDVKENRIRLWDYYQGNVEGGSNYAAEAGETPF